MGGDSMKHKGSILICTVALSILLGLSTSQNAKADTTQDENVTTQAVITAQTTGENTANVQASTEQVAETKTDVTTQNDGQQDIKQYPGGDWDVDPTTATAQQNFYYYVNGKWQQNAKIPSDQSSTGVTDDMDDVVTKKMQGDLNKFADGTKKTSSLQLQQAVDYYKKALETTSEHQSGIDDINKDIQKIESLQNYTDLNNNLQNFDSTGIPLPFSLGVENDPKNSNKEILSFDAPDTILPDNSYYDDDDDGTIMLSRYSEAASKLLELSGFDQSKIEDTVEQALEFDRGIVAHSDADSDDLDDTIELYNPMDMDKFVSSFKDMKVGDYAAKAFPTNKKTVHIYNNKYIQTFNDLVDQKNFDQLKSWMIVRLLTNNANYLGSDATNAISPFNEKISGVSELPSAEKQAYNMTTGVFNQILSEYYGKTYFGEAAKKDVTRLIDNILDVYHDRIQNNTWLSESTKQNALNKLSKINLKVAYPESVPDYYRGVKISKTKSLYAINKELNTAVFKKTVSDFTKPVDRSVWSMPSFMVNAQYDPTLNDVTIPAAILQAPFYSIDQSDSANYGGIGATIGHEISHAFDNNGAQFDAEGNYNNWWTDSDFTKFKQKTKEMADLWDGIPYAGGTVDGNQTVGENIADNGGLNAALQAAKEEKNFNAKEFFEGWAKSWRYKATPERESYLLKIDEHAPEPLRVTVGLQNLDDFFTTYDIKPGDAMWLASKDRVHIW